MASIGDLLKGVSSKEFWANVGEAMTPVLVAFAPYLAEFLGTLFVTLTFGFNLLSGNPQFTPLSVGFAYMVCMYATADVSGGHLNPALTLAFGLSRKMAWSRVWGYWISQLLAGMVGAIFSDTLSVRGRTVIVKPQSEFDWVDAAICEVVYSAMFCFVALNCMASLKANPRGERNQYFAVAVGFVAITGGYATYNISGGFFNPALTLGFTLFGSRTDDLTSDSVSALSEKAWGGAYIGFQATGAVVATILFLMVRPEELRALGVTGDMGKFGFHHALSVVCPSCFGRGDREDREDCEGAKEEQADEAGFVDGDIASSPWLIRLLSEFVGTYSIVLTYGLSMICRYVANGNSAIAPSTTMTLPTEALGSNITSVDAHMKRDMSGSPGNTVAWATGAAVLSQIYALGNASGGHFNPAVTLAVVLSGRGICSLPEGLSIIVIQGLAALAAALTYVCVHRGRTRTQRTLDLGPQGDNSWRTVALCEAGFTMAISLIYLCMLTVKSATYGKRPNLHGFQFALAVGMAVIAGGFALEGISGGVLNPAVALGHEAGNFLIDFQLGNRLHTFFAYAIWQCVGGLGAAFLFAAIHPLEYKKDLLLEG